MDHLRELAFAISNRKIPFIRILTNEHHKKGSKSKYYQLYKALETGELKTEKEVARHFGFVHPSPEFSRFKREFEKRIFNTLLFLNPTKKKATYYDQRLIYLRQLTAIRQLKNAGGRLMTIKMLKKLLQKTIEEHYTDIALECATELKFICSISPNSHKEYSKYRDLASELGKTLTLERNVQELYEESLLIILNPKIPKSDQINSIGSKVDTINHLKKEASFLTIDFLLYSLSVSIIFYELTGNLKDFVLIVSDGIANIKKKLKRPLSTLLSYHLHIAKAYITLGEFNNAKTEVLLAIKLTAINSINWYRCKQILVLNYFRSGEFGLAYTEILDIINNHRFHSIPKFEQEIWKIQEGYCYFLILAGKIKANKKDFSIAKAFTLSNIRMDLPAYNKDKQRTNVLLIVLQILLTLTESQYDLIEYQLEALNRYKTRNLKEKENYLRTICFVKLLNLIPKHAHQPQKLEWVGMEYLRMLKSTPIPHETQFESEYIPFESLWAIILEILQNPLPHPVDNSPPTLKL